MLLYYITDRKQFAGDEPARRHALLKKIAEAALSGVDVVQLREKDLSGRDLEGLASEVVRTVRQKSSHTRVLINSRTDIAIACDADGVHLPSSDISPSEVRAAWRHGSPLVSVACHALQEVTGAATEAADWAVFAPVFEKQGSPVAGLSGLRAACKQAIKVVALGGVTWENAQACLDAGAAGIAGIRLFQENDVARVIAKLRQTAASTRVI